MIHKHPSQHPALPHSALWRDLVLLSGLGAVAIGGAVFTALQVANDGPGPMALAAGLASLAAIAMLLMRQYRLGQRLAAPGSPEALADAKAQYEQLLTMHQDSYRQHLENTPEAIAVHGANGVLYVNPAALHLMRTDAPEQLLGHSVLEFAHPDSIDVIRQRIHYIKTEGRKVEAMEEKIIRLNGEVAEVEVSAMPVNFEGTPAIQITLRDITVRKQLAAAQQASEEKFSRVFTSAPIAISISTEIRNARKIGRP